MAIIGYWKMRGNGSNEVGTTNLVATNVSFDSTKGQDGVAVFPKLTTSYLRSSAVILTGVTEMTYEFYGKVNELGTNVYQSLISDRSTVNWYYAYAIRLSNWPNTMTANALFNTDGAIRSASCQPSAKNKNSYAHIGFSFKSGQPVLVFINGNIAISAGYTYTISTARLTTFGLEPAPGATQYYPVSGYMDFGRINNKYHSPAQIKNNYLLLKGFI